MEDYFAFETPDGKVIEGTINAVNDEKEKVIIFAHGLTGHENEHIYYNAAKFFPKHGYDTVRFNFYPGGETGRKLVDCDLNTHVVDYQQVIDSFADEYEKIFLIGHSLGGPIVLSCNSDKAIASVLWDPSYEPAKIPVKKFDEEHHIVNWGTQILLSNLMIESWKQYGTSDGKVKLPTRIIVAGESSYTDEWSPSDKTNEVDIVVVKNASHTFDEEGVEDELFSHTLDWLNKF